MRVHTELNFKGVFTPSVNVDTRVGAQKEYIDSNYTPSISISVDTSVKIQMRPGPIQNVTASVNDVTRVTSI